MSLPAVNRKELAQSLAEKFGMTAKDSEAAVSAVIGAMAGALKDGREIRVPDLGSLSVADVAARTARNPKTGETMQVPASKKIRFKPSKQFKESSGVA